MKPETLRRTIRYARQLEVDWLETGAPRRARREREEEGGTTESAERESRGKPRLGVHVCFVWDLKEVDRTPRALCCLFSVGRCACGFLAGESVNREILEEEGEEECGGMDALDFSRNFFFNL